MQAALAAFGRVDVLVNNAGILRDKAFHKMDHTMIDPVIDVYLKGALYVSQPAFRLMRDQGYGRIVNTSSASGRFGHFGQANYGAAKAGLAGCTRVLAIEGAGHGIKVNAIAPIASTRMTEDLLGDLAAAVSPESVSPLVAYLAHEECSVNGHVYSAAAPGRPARSDWPRRTAAPARTDRRRPTQPAPDPGAWSVVLGVDRGGVGRVDVGVSGACEGAVWPASRKRWSRSSWVRRRPRAIAQSICSDGCGPRCLLAPPLVDALRAGGLSVTTGTVDEPALLRRSYRCAPTR